MVQFIMEQVARKINTCLLSGWSAPGNLHAPSFNLSNNTSPFYREWNTHTGEVVSWKVAEPGFKPCPAWLQVWAHLLCHYLLKPQKRPFGNQTGEYSGLLWASTWIWFRSYIQLPLFTFQMIFVDKDILHMWWNLCCCSFCLEYEFI